MKQKGYKSYEYYVHNPELRAVIDQLNVGFGDGVSIESNNTDVSAFHDVLMEVNVVFLEVLQNLE